MTGVMRAARLHAGPGGQAKLRLDTDVPIPVAGAVALGAAVVGWQIGARVVVDPIIACRHCENCIRGKTKMCRNSRVFGVQTEGGYTEYAVAPARQLWGVPKGLDYAAAGVRVIATAGGADKVRQFIGGCGVDIAFEHVGEATWESSLKARAGGGRLVTCGGHSGVMVGFNRWHLFVKGHGLTGSFGGTRRDFPDVMKMAGQGNLRQVVQQVVSLADVPRAQDMRHQRRVFGKLMLDPTLA